jgi:hypothetical protein
MSLYRYKRFNYLYLFQMTPSEQPCINVTLRDTLALNRTNSAVLDPVCKLSPHGNCAGILAARPTYTCRP